MRAHTYLALSREHRWLLETVAVVHPHAAAAPVALTAPQDLASIAILSTDEADVLLVILFFFFVVVVVLLYLL